MIITESYNREDGSYVLNNHKKSTSLLRNYFKKIKEKEGHSFFKYVSNEIQCTAELFFKSCFLSCISHPLKKFYSCVSGEQVRLNTGTDIQDNIRTISRYQNWDNWQEIGEYMQNSPGICYGMTAQFGIALLNSHNGESEGLTYEKFLLYLDILTGNSNEEIYFNEKDTKDLQNFVEELMIYQIRGILNLEKQSVFKASKTLGKDLCCVFKHNFVALEEEEFIEQFIDLLDEKLNNNKYFYIHICTSDHATGLGFRDGKALFYEHRCCHYRYGEKIQYAREFDLNSQAEKEKLAEFIFFSYNEEEDYSKKVKFHLRGYALETDD
ncbi:MAG: hypothetical protein OXC48_04235 [Endozoicomonadaceae bacterium]|nr:hypothetical protein [Endozoicomonadaceae bacterium]